MPTPNVSHVPEAILEQIRRAFELANDYVISDIECNCVATTMPGSAALWFDTSSMLDAHELSDPAVDMTRQALAYADEAGLIERHRNAPHLVRIVRWGA